MNDTDSDTLDAARKHDAAAVRAKAAALTAAFHDLYGTIDDQRTAEVSRGSPSAVTSYDNALAKLDRVKSEIVDMAVELVAAFYFRAQ